MSFDPKRLQRAEEGRLRGRANLALIANACRESQSGPLCQCMQGEPIWPSLPMHAGRANLALIANACRRTPSHACSTLFPATCLAGDTKINPPSWFLGSLHNPASATTPLGHVLFLVTQCAKSIAVQGSYA